MAIFTTTWGRLRPRFDSWVRKIPWRRDRLPTLIFLGFPGGSAGKESACNAGDLGLIPGLGRSLEKGTATHSSILAWRIPWTYSPWGHKALDMTERLSLQTGEGYSGKVKPREGAFQVLVDFIWMDLLISLIPGSRRSPGGGHGKPLQYSCLENPMDRGAWRAMIHRVKKSWTQLKQLSMHANLKSYL